MAAFQQRIERIVPFLADRVRRSTHGTRSSSSPFRSIASGVASPRPALHRRCRPCHVAQSVASASTSPCRTRSPPPNLAHRIPTLRLRHRTRSQSVQNYREAPIRNTQRAQVFAHRMLSYVLRSTGPFVAPLPFRIVTSFPGFRHLTASLEWACNLNTSGNSSVLMCPGSIIRPIIVIPTGAKRSGGICCFFSLH